jgi:4-amino-4-deoxy-L-arabinose transferase-like glycosyltransferase
VGRTGHARGFATGFGEATSRPGRALALIFLLALALRLCALWLSLDTPLAGDEPEYFARAVRRSMGLSGIADSGRAPGAIAGYAAAFWGFGVSVEIAKCVNVLASSLTVLPAYWIGRAWGGVSAGLLGALGVALYPNFIAFSHFLWSEPLYLLWIALALALLIAGKGPASWGRVAGAGVLLGASALTKESGVVFVPLAAGWVAWQSWRPRPRAAAGRAACLLAASALVVAPWVAHINRPDLPLALITRTGGMNLFIGNHPISRYQGMQEYKSLSANPLEIDTIARERAIGSIRSRLPAWPLEKLAEEGPRFFTPTSFAVRRLLAPEGGGGGWRYRLALPFGEAPTFRALAVAGVVAAYVGVLLAGAAGWVLARRRELSALFGLFLLGQLVPSLVTFSMSRFRLPAMLFFILGAALLGTEGRRDWKSASLARRGLALAAVAGLIVCLGLDYESVLASSGR